LTGKAVCDSVYLCLISGIRKGGQKMAQRKAIYSEEKKDIVSFLQWVVGDFQQDLSSINPRDLFVSEQLFEEMVKNAKGQSMFAGQFLIINKGPKMNKALKGYEVVYNGFNGLTLYNLDSNCF